VNKLNGKIMRKYLLTLISVLALSSVYAQTDDKSEGAEAKGPEYNRWSVELNVGQNKPEKPFAPGYFTADFGEYFNFSGANHYDLGVRYMFNPNFGAKIDFAFDSMDNQNSANQAGTPSLLFETRQYRVGFQGVVNLSRIMKFETFTSRFGILAHSGIQVSQLAPQKGISGDKPSELNGGFMIGLTPQFRISNKVVLTGDFTYLSNVRQHYNWDGSNSDVTNNLFGSMLNTSLGLTFYLGNYDVHADWYHAMDSGLKEKVEDLEKRLADIETGLVDSDADGVADMFDAEPNTMAGIATDAKGRTIDRNGNGIADELERYFDSKYVKDKRTAEQDYDLKSLINEAYVNVYFDFNSKTPTLASADGINFLVKYLNANPSATADVIGYADEIGSSAFNDNLSNERATNVKQILVDAGISASRLNVVANGEDKSVNKDSKGARSIVRKVTFKIK
jgi:OOP family OmpA-OmpF porin